MNAARRSFLLDTLTGALPQTMLLMILGAAIGFAINTQRTDPLPVDLPGSLLLTESGAPVVFPGRAYDLYKEGRHVFVDARRQHLHVAGHIEGSLSMPLEDFDLLLPELQLWTAGQPILVYGSEKDFVTVDDLARRLIETGEPEVVLLAPGVEAWEARGYPMATGTAGLIGEAYEAYGEGGDR